jgi:hypothetical protein
MDTYWFPSYPQILDRTAWTDGSEQGECFAYGTGVVATSNCLGSFTMTSPGTAAPEPANLFLIGAGLLAILAFRYSARTLWTNWTAIDPSPTAAATRFMLPDRTSPTANTPGRLVSSK